MGRLLAALLLIALVVVGLGFYLGWFRVSTSSPDGGTNVSLHVDKDKIKHDSDAVKDKTKQVINDLKNKAPGQAGSKTVKGTVSDVNRGTGELTIAGQDGKTTAVRVTDKTVLERDGQRITLNDLAAGQTVTAVYAAQENVNVADSVTVTK